MTNEHNLWVLYRVWMEIRQMYLIRFYDECPDVSPTEIMEEAFFCAVQNQWGRTSTQIFPEWGRNGRITWRDQLITVCWPDPMLPNLALFFFVNKRLCFWVWSPFVSLCQDLTVASEPWKPHEMGLDTEELQVPARLCALLQGSETGLLPHKGRGVSLMAFMGDTRWNLQLHYQLPCILLERTVIAPHMP